MQLPDRGPRHRLALVGPAPLVTGVPTRDVVIYPGTAIAWLVAAPQMRIQLIENINPTLELAQRHVPDGASHHTRKVNSEVAVLVLVYPRIGDVCFASGKRSSSPPTVTFGPRRDRPRRVRQASPVPARPPRTSPRRRQVAILLGGRVPTAIHRGLVVVAALRMCPCGLVVILRLCDGRPMCCQRHTKPPSTRAYRQTHPPAATSGLCRPEDRHMQPPTKSCQQEIGSLRRRASAFRQP